MRTALFASKDRTMRYSQVMLDPHDLDGSVARLSSACEFAAEDLAALRRIIALLPCATPVVVDESYAARLAEMPLVDKFTFDMEHDELILFDSDAQTVIDGLIEMVMYLTGFSTLMGNPEPWVVEFAIGAWKPVKKRVKRQLDLPVDDQPRGVVGAQPLPDKALATDPYPFRTMVSHYDMVSFHQMVMLAGRDDVAVYFPPETHPKVLAVYVYARRAMQEVGQGLGLVDYREFNERLRDQIRRFEQLFDPDRLEPPQWLGRPPVARKADSNEPQDDPFARFIEQLFSDDDAD
jgi:hypothetical protein